MTGDITLAAGSLLDLEGGGHVLANGQLQTGSNGVPLGTGGSLTLATYQGINKPPTSNGAPPVHGHLVLDGTIDAFEFNGGGTLTLNAVALQIGGDAATTPSYAFYFDPTHWGSLGFGSFNLSSVLQSEVPAGATVMLRHQNLLPNLVAAGAAPNGADPAAFSTVGFLTGTLLSPTNLSVSAGLEAINGGPGLTPSGSDYAQVDVEIRKFWPIPAPMFLSAHMWRPRSLAASARRAAPSRLRSSPPMALASLRDRFISVRTACSTSPALW